MFRRLVIWLIGLGMSFAVVFGGIAPHTALAAAHVETSPATASGSPLTVGTSASSSIVSLSENTASPGNGFGQPGTQTNQNRPIGYAKGFHSFSRRSTSRYYGYGSSYRYGRPRFGFGGFGSHMFSFGAGWFLGSLFHPFGGYYGWGGLYGYHHFSLFGFILDLFILWVIWRIIRAFLRRR